MNRYLSLTSLLVLLLLAGINQVSSQPFTLEEHIQPQELGWADHTKKGEDKPSGRISLNELTQEKDTMYYFIKDLNMYAPTYFSLNSSDPEADIIINLCKENWKTAHRTGEVKGKKLWKTDFKTEGDFGIMVIANKKPVNYVLLVWTGKEMKIDMPSVFKEPDGTTVKTAGTSKTNNNLLFIVAGVVLLGVIGVLAYKLKNKKAIS